MSVGGGLNFWPTDLVGLVPSWAQTRPGSTRGQPYLLRSNPKKMQQKQTKQPKVEATNPEKQQRINKATPMIRLNLGGECSRRENLAWTELPFPLFSKLPWPSLLGSSFDHHRHHRWWFDLKLISLHSNQNPLLSSQFFRSNDKPQPPPS